MHQRVPFEPFSPMGDAREASAAFFGVMSKRRSVREFSDRPVEVEVIRSLVRAAGTAPSGANKQPWRFIAVSDPSLKKQIREAAEAEEREFYARRAGEAWLRDLEPLGTDADKSFLEDAPWVIAVFKLIKDDDGGQTYYVNESVGVAVGFLLAAIHHAGLVSLTHTPSPMGFLSKILRRPAHERPYLLIPVGYAASGCSVPDIRRKELGEILVES